MEGLLFATSWFVRKGALLIQSVLGRNNRSTIGLNSELSLLEDHLPNLKIPKVGAGGVMVFGNITNRVQILDVAVCISHSANAFGKSISDLFVPPTGRIWHKVFYYNGDLEEGEVEYQPKLVACRTMLVMESLGAMWTILCQLLLSLSTCLPGDLAGHRFSQTQRSSTMLVIDPLPIWRWFVWSQGSFSLEAIIDQWYSTQHACQAALLKPAKYKGKVRILPFSL